MMTKSSAEALIYWKMRIIDIAIQLAKTESYSGEVIIETLSEIGNAICNEQMMSNKRFSSLTLPCFFIQPWSLRLNAPFQAFKIIFPQFTWLLLSIEASIVVLIYERHVTALYRIAERKICI